MKGSITKNKDDTWVPFCTVFILIAAWQILSLNLPSILFPSPLETLTAFVQMVQSGELVKQIGVSSVRMFMGFLIGMFLAIICGLIAGQYSIVYRAFSPILSLLLGLPPIILVVLAMVWFGTGWIVPVFVVSVLVFPGIYLNTADGWRNIDKQLLEMAHLYKSSPFHTLKHIILPGLTVPIFTAVSLASGSAVRITIMAELLGADNGVGYSLALARVNIDTARVFAWTLVSVAIIILLDHFVIHPLKRKTLKWNMEEV